MLMRVIVMWALLWPVPPLIPTLGTPEMQEGLATYYSAGVFERVVKNRGNIEPCGDCVGYAAMLYPADMNKRVCVEYKGRHSGRLQVVDVAAAHHRQALIDKGWIVDLDRDVWLGLGLPERPTTVKMWEC